MRRIEALTAEGARAYLAQQDARVRELAGALRTRPEDVVDRVKALLEERKQLERQLADAKRQIALGGGAAPAANGKGADGAAGAIRAVGDVKLLARTVQGLNPKDLRGLIDDGKKQVGSGVVAIVGVTEDGKAGLAVGVTDDLTKRISAVDLVKAGAEALGGKGGGGRPDMAQAGGPDGSKAEAALAGHRGASRRPDGSLAGVRGSLSMRGLPAAGTVASVLGAGSLRTGAAGNPRSRARPVRPARARNRRRCSTASPRARG